MKTYTNLFSSQNNQVFGKHFAQKGLSWYMVRQQLFGATSFTRRSHLPHTIYTLEENIHKPYLKVPSSSDFTAVEAIISCKTE